MWQLITSTCLKMRHENYLYGILLGPATVVSACLTHSLWASETWCAPRCGYRRWETCQALVPLELDQAGMPLATGMEGICGYMHMMPTVSCSKSDLLCRSEVLIVHELARARRLIPLLEMQCGRRCKWCATERPKTRVERAIE